MTIPPEFLPVLQITLPLLGGMWIASHAQNKRLDDIIARLTNIENVLRAFGERLATLEARTKLVNR